MTPFAFQRPDSLDAAIGLLAAGGAETKILAGGQSLLLALKERKARPNGIVSIAGLPEMRGTRAGPDGGLIIGPATTYADLARTTLPGWQQELPAVAGNLADRSVRNIGTIGGGVCQADPRYDMPIVLSGAGATFTLSSTGGTRLLLADDFFNIAGGTHIAPDEILTAITLPPLAHWSRLVFEKFRYRTFEAAIGLVAIGVALEDGKISRIRIAIGAVAPAPSVARQTMAGCLGKSLDELDIEAVATAASHEALPPANAVTRQQKYQSELTISLVKRAFARLRAGDAA